LDAIAFLLDVVNEVGDHGEIDEEHKNLGDGGVAVDLQGFDGYKRRGDELPTA
jgi:hypothetical protein